MPVTVDVPEHGQVEFPDGMSQEQMESALKEAFPSKSTAAADETQVRKDLGVAGYPVPASGEERAARDYELRKQAGEDFGHLSEYNQSIPRAINQAMGDIGRIATEVVNAPIRAVNLLEGQTPGSEDYVAPLDSEKPLVTIPQIKPEQMEGESKPTQVAAGVYNKIAQFGTGITAPGTILPAVMLPGAASKVAFGTQIAANIPGTIQESAGILRDKNATMMEKGGAAAAPLLESYVLKQITKAEPILPQAAKAAAEVTGMAEKGVPNASSQRPPAEVHGNVSAQPVEGAGQVPVEESQPGVQPQEKAPEVQQPLRLTPDDQAHLEAERGSVDVPVEVRERSANEPFVKGQYMTIDRDKGTIVVRPGEFSGMMNEEMAGRSPEDKRLLVRSALAEERIHLGTTPEDADAYVASLTPMELGIERKIYTGKFGGRSDISPTLIGFEAIRRRMQRLARMDSTETAATAGLERWSLKSLETLGDVIRKIRETLGTKGSKEGLAILDRVQGNLDAAKVVAGKASPSALRRESPEERDNSARAAILAQEKQAQEMRDAGHADLAESLEDNVTALKKANPGWERQSFPAALRRDYQKNWELQHDEFYKRFGVMTVGGKLAIPHSVTEEAARAMWSKGGPSKAIEFYKSFLANNPEIGDQAKTRIASVVREIDRISKSGEAVGNESVSTLDAGGFKAGPSAIRRKQQADQPEFILPPAERGIERPAATELGAKPMETPPYLTPDKLHWEGPRKEGAFRRITDAEAKSPLALKEILPKGAREGGSSRPESVTHNVTALFDHFTGRVEVVSTYKSGRDGLLLADPTLISENSSRPHRQIGTLLNRYTPIYAISLKEPVQNFHERFSSLGDFQERFGNAATDEASKRLGNAPQASIGASGKGQPFQADQFDLPTEIAAPEPPQSAEAGAIHDFFRGQMPKTQAQMQTAIARGAARASRQMISGLQRMMEFEQAKDPNISAEEAISQSLDNIYDDLTKSQDRAAFIQRTMGRFAEPVAKANEPAPVAPKEAPVIPEGPLSSPTGAEPSSLRRRIQDPIEDRFFRSVGQVRGLFLRQGIKKDISALVDKATNEAVPLSQQAKNNIRQPSTTKRLIYGNKNDLRAARAINASYSPSYRPSAGMPGAGFASPSVKSIAHPDPSVLPELIKMTEGGMAKAESLIKNPTQAQMTAVGLPEIKGLSRGSIVGAARKWLKAAKELRQEVQYAQDHFDDPALMDTAVRLREQTGDQIAREHAAGKTTNEVENYLQGLTKGEIYGDHSVTFEDKVIGKSYGKPKTFANVYEAIEAGPYIPVFNDVSESVAHRIRVGASSIISDQAFKAPLAIEDPVSKAPVAIESELSPNGGYQVPGGNLQYTLVYPNSGGKPIAVREGYVKLMKDLFGRSGLQEMIGGKALLKFGAFEKHSTLAGDVYHLSKMMMYALGVSARDAGFRGAHTALEFYPKDMPEAVKRGVISQAEMDWALKPETIVLDGKTQRLTRQEILKEMQKTNLNVGRVQDAMYRHFIDALDVEIGGRKFGIGAYNRFLFDKWTRGFMANSAVSEFLRLHAAAPSIDARAIMKRVGNDLNTQFGSSGKQGAVKNPTLLDIAQLGFLAAQWVGTRIATEAKFLSRLATTPIVAATKGRQAANVHFGSLGRGVGRGIVIMFAVTQAINMITRGQFTWQNQEKDHKLDAWVPDFHGGPGHWISPLSVFMEITHDVARYMAGDRKNLAETIAQVGENKLGPLGRAVGVLASGYTPMGQKIPTTMGRIKEAGKALIPVPITVSSLGREIGNKVAPSLVAPNRHGTLQHQVYASLGIKSEYEKSANAQILQKAKDFMDENHLTKDTGWEQVQTINPNYTKLRSALQNGDTAGAQRIITYLKQTRSNNDLIKAMKHWRDHPFTGSKKAELAFQRAFTQDEAELYAKAKTERAEVVEKFYDALLQGK